MLPGAQWTWRFWRGCRGGFRLSFRFALLLSSPWGDGSNPRFLRFIIEVQRTRGGRRFWLGAIRSHGQLVRCSGCSLEPAVSVLYAKGALSEDHLHSCLPLTWWTGIPNQGKLVISNSIEKEVKEQARLENHQLDQTGRGEFNPES